MTTSERSVALRPPFSTRSTLPVTVPAITRSVWRSHTPIAAWRVLETGDIGAFTRRLARRQILAFDVACGADRRLPTREPEDDPFALMTVHSKDDGLVVHMQDFTGDN